MKSHALSKLYPYLESKTIIFRFRSYRTENTLFPSQRQLILYKELIPPYFNQNYPTQQGTALRVVNNTAVLLQVPNIGKYLPVDTAEHTREGLNLPSFTDQPILFKGDTRTEVYLIYDISDGGSTPNLLTGNQMIHKL
jgi:hypothetical protein